ncbi:alpha/beta hydrolase fold-3 domain-containing protein [Truncatella angustata]|uniref:Alpha/beta hydrolase fold-3 domain-containing protein n=1 Tax=Truncatella angustata TaxID=152316 RepID=A0A9P8ZVK4_9PEZI|nr:alpha/beta hydrolase fold-3 domain-containing protein [Truncatella angustata]KAH6648998.1 alpha/beta hydrolase fold-3 domain-containing protein [Truncatella angustata]
MSRPAEYPWLSYQPIRLFYTLSRFGLIIAHLPYWTLVSLIPACRPIRSWTFRQAYMNSLGEALTYVLSRVRILEDLSFEAGSKGDRWQVLEPFEEHFYTGPLNSPNIQPAKVGGTWYPSKPATEDLKGCLQSIIVHIHGGAFVMGNGRTAHSGFLARTLVEHAQADADTLTSYLYMVRDLGISPNRIVLSGDSAGANLAIALLRYIEEFGSELGLSEARPSCAVSISPWSPHWKTDYLPVLFLRRGATTYGGKRLKEDPHATAIGNPYKTSVPIFVGMGQGGVLQDEGARWAREMQAIDGNHTQVEYEENATHDTLLMGAMLAWEESAQKVATNIGQFIGKHQSGLNI